MARDWSTLTASQFEELCYRLLEANGFTNLKWFGKAGGDKGRDIVAEKVEEPLFGAQRLTRWIVQCKRWTERALSKGTLRDELAAAIEHEPDSVLLILPSTLTPNTKEWLKAVGREFPFSIFTWEELDLDREVVRNKSRLYCDFPQLYATGETIEFYPMSHHKFELSCNEFEDVFIVAFNVSTYEEAKARALAFVEFIKANDIVFSEESE